MTAAFHAYPSAQHFYPIYSRAEPMYADLVEFDRSGEYSTTEYAFVANAPKIMHFTANVLWQSLVDGAYMTPLFFIKRVGWPDYKELAGTDLIARQLAPSMHNQGQCLSRLVSLQAGDKVQCRPCIAANPGLYLTNAVSGDGINTCNYFSGFEV